MKKVNKMCLLSLLSLSVCFVNSENVVNAAAPVAPNNMAALEVLYDAEYDVSYYSEIEGKSGDELLEGLAKISASKHQKYNNYDSLRGASCYSDDDYNDNVDTHYIDFYTGWRTPNIWDSGNTWNREHVWCQILSGDLYGTSGAGSDLHHLRPSINKINNSRGNKPFAEIEHNETNKHFMPGTQTWTGCYQTSDYFEPSEDKRGDTARVLMYTYMHYSNEVETNITNHADYSGDLTIQNIVKTSQNTDQAAWDLLVKWNNLDPVDDLERQRNDYCASTLGLRNPFIDHQEFADMIWNPSYDGGGALLDENNFYNDYLTLTVTKATLDIDDTYKINPNTNVEGTISYASNNTNIATIDANGMITAKQSGQANITVSLGNLTRTFIVEVNKENVEVGGQWTLVKDASTLNVGDSIVIAAYDSKYSLALSTNQTNNNRKATPITKDATTNTILIDDTVQQITLEEGTKANTFAFNADGKYLYAASSSSNHLKSSTTLNDNASWSVTIDSNGKATIVAQGTNTRNNLKYNPQNSLFACYASGQQDVCIYKNMESTTPDIPQPDISEGGNSEPNTSTPEVSEPGTSDITSEPSTSNPVISDGTISEPGSSNEPTPSNKGCKGSASASIFAIISLLMVLSKKKKI